MEIAIQIANPGSIIDIKTGGAGSRPAARPRLLRARPNVVTGHVLYVYRLVDY
jgi:hypothetical protein